MSTAQPPAPGHWGTLPSQPANGSGGSGGATGARANGNGQSNASTATAVGGSGVAGVSGTSKLGNVNPSGAAPVLNRPTQLAGNSRPSLRDLAKVLPSHELRQRSTQTAVRQDTGTVTGAAGVANATAAGSGAGTGIEAGPSQTSLYYQRDQGATANASVLGRSMTGSGSGYLQEGAGGGSGPGGLTGINRTTSERGATRRSATGGGSSSNLQSAGSSKTNNGHVSRANPSRSNSAVYMPRVHSTAQAQYMAQQQHQQQQQQQGTEDGADEPQDTGSRYRTPQRVMTLPNGATTMADYALQASGSGLTAGQKGEEFMNGLSNRQGQVQGDLQQIPYGPSDEPLDETYDPFLANNDALQYFVNKRHLTSGNPRDPSSEEKNAAPWRLKIRTKTYSGGLVLCLNLGVDPPDVVKTQPCAKLETWLDPASLPPNKALERIGQNLQQQFETLSPKVRYKQYLDPSVEETNKFAVNLRKQAKEERVLLCYNGHGVPKPTASGEIWVFNKNYTQYIPVSLYDLQSWLGSPCIFVWDCSAAVNIVSNFNRWAERRDSDFMASHKAGMESSNGSVRDTPPPAYTPFMDCIHLAACQADQTLPMTPELPADLFTSCLTSPIEMALRFFVLQDPLRINADPNDPRAKVTVDLSMKIPGDLKDRRTPLGELNWIFTAVTDTIAWLVFPPDIFKRLFRQDLLVAALFRNFLLAERVMRAYHCTPVSHPALPATHNHPLWNSWDLAVDACLSQLPALLEAEAFAKENPGAPPKYAYQPSRFFAEHLQAFDLWLQHAKPNQPPDQLPIVLQVLLSQAHRLRALVLLCKFVDLGPWAVHAALSIGIFPYVQKLLQSPAVDLKPVLIFIWSRILAVDRGCQVDLLKDNGFTYFSKILAPANPQSAPLVIPNATEHRAMCAFILSMVCRGYRPGQAACVNSDVFRSCAIRLQEDDWLLKSWSALCLAQLWDGFDDAKMLAVREAYQDRLIRLLKDDSVEVRAAVMYALGTFLGASGTTDGKGGGGTGALMELTERQQLLLEAGLAQACVLQTHDDASPLVRKELVVVISCVVREWRGWFVAAAWHYYEEQQGPEGQELAASALKEWGERPDRDSNEHIESIRLLAAFKLMFTTLLEFSVDPHPEVASCACTVVDYVVALLLDSSFPRASGSTFQARKLESRPRLEQRRPIIPPVTPTTGVFTPAVSTPEELEKPIEKRPDTPVQKVTSTLKRNGSIATALKNLASMTGYNMSPEDRPPTPPPPPGPAPAPSRSTTQLHVQTYIPPYPMMSKTDTVANNPSARSSTDKLTRTSSLGSILASSQRGDFSYSSGGDSTPAFAASAVIQTLAEEDMERLRIRRSSRTEAGGGPDGKSERNPTDLGIGMVAKEVKDDVLPLRSDFYDYSMEYFKEPQMKKPDADEPGSTRYNELTWRQQRNVKMLEVVRDEIEEYAPYCPWTRNLGTLSNHSWPALLGFHSFEPHLAVGDEADNVCIWDWKSKQRLAKFSVGAGPVSSFHFVNETATSLLLTASTDGSIRLWRDYETAPALASAFRGMTESHPVTRRAGVVTSWDQYNGHLSVGGDSKFVRIFDAGVEAPLLDIPTQAGSPMTSIASDHTLFYGGFGDGVVRIFDKRLAPDRAVVRVLRQHHAWIANLTMQRGEGRELVSGSMNGEVKVWDIRVSETPISSVTIASNGLSALAVHEQCPIFAATSAPYNTASATASTQSGHGIPQFRPRQRLNVYRIDQEDYLDGSTTDSSMDFEAAGDAPRQVQMNGSSRRARRMTDPNGDGDDAVEPHCLSSSVLRGDAEMNSIQGAQGGPHSSHPTLPSLENVATIAPIPGVSGAVPYIKRKFGAGCNAMVFHPNEMVLAVGGFDHMYGSVRLISYDKSRNSRRQGSAHPEDMGLANGTPAIVRQ